MSILQTKYSFLKKCFPKIKFIICFVLLILALVSCDGKTEQRNTGVKANKEILASIYQCIEEQKNPILADEDDVFWTPAGMIWHTNSLCASLANSDIILHGSADEAMTAGKERECSRCVGASKLPSFDDEIEESDVFFTPNGTIWHLYDSCVYLANSETILHGSVDEAILVGKARECSKCSKQSGQTSVDDDIKAGDVFWTSGGTIWHISRSCSYIANSKAVNHGSVMDAIFAGMTRKCAKCSTQNTQPPIDEENRGGYVFWTSGGMRWHTDNECYHIANSETVYHGTTEEAQNAGKSGLCSVCEKSENNIK